MESFDNICCNNSLAKFGVWGLGGAVEKKQLKQVRGCSPYKRLALGWHLRRLFQKAPTILKMEELSRPDLSVSVVSAKHLFPFHGIQNLGRCLYEQAQRKA